MLSLHVVARASSPSPVVVHEGSQRESSLREKAAGLVYGTVTDANGTPLPFANVFVEGTTRGCATNLEGYYELALEPGNHVLVVRYLGYTSQRQALPMSAARRELNWLLQPEALTLQDVIISGSEDPGMAIMRKAIAARESFRRETGSFSTDAYIKGLQRIDGAPEKIMGIRIDAGDMLDSNNTGIVYLSESYSRLHVDKPGTPSARSKEEMLASKVSGDDQGFSWNEAAPMEVTFYDPRLNINGVAERDFISPLADDAFFFYRFVLAGTFLEDGRLINKIEVLPRRRQDPVFRGHVYIVEDTWRLYGTDMLLTRDAGIEFIDSLQIQMTYSPVDSARWMPVSRQFRFRFGILGIRGQGYFMAFYSNYALDPSFPKGFFGPEVMRIQDGANEKDSLFWEARRPVPLSPLEAEDYREKDILAKKREDKGYLDSLDRLSNRPQIMDVLLGYSNENSYKKTRWYIDALLNTIGFNTVEGRYGSLGGGWNREMPRNRVWRVNGQLRYGIGNGRLQADGRVQWVSDPIHFQRFELAGGKAITDYHPGAVSGLVNSLYAQFLRRSYLKLYEVHYVEASMTRQLFNGFRASGTLHWANRIPLRNTSDLTWLALTDREFTSNDPLDEENFDWPFLEHRISRYTLSFRYQIAQRYATEPDRRFLLGSKWPELQFRVMGAAPVLGSGVDYLRLDGGLTYSVSLGLVGRSDLNFGVGGFLRSDSLPFQDYRHFTGNQTNVLRPELARFNVLPYFARSTDQYWFEWHYEHHFNGFVFNKIPGIRKLRWQLVGGTHGLYTPDGNWYTELAVGIEHIFKVGRIEFGAGWGEGAPAYNVLVGLGF